MIIMPHIDGCTIVTENGFCSVMGHPFDIIEGLFIKRTKIDDIDSSKEPFQRISIETLQKQLEVKDKQIEQLNEQLKMAQINLNQSQQLALEQSKKIKELEAPKETAESVKETPKKKSLFERIFGI